MITQEELNQAHRSLEALIKVATRTRIECCSTGDTVNRDKLAGVISHLYAALGIAGNLDFGGGVQTMSGDK